MTIKSLATSLNGILIEMHENRLQHLITTTGTVKTYKGNSCLDHI